MRAIQNKAFYKVFLKRQTPNIEAIEEHLAAFKKSEDLFLSNYLGNKDLMGGNDINVCDLIASATFEQVNILKHLSLNHLKLSCLLYRSMTQLLPHTIAHFTRFSFMPKASNHPYKNF